MGWIFMSLTNLCANVALIGGNIFKKVVHVK